MKLKVKKLHPEAVMPKYATDGSNAFDLTAVSVEHIIENGLMLTVYNTGLGFEIPPGFCGLVLPRSSLSKNTTFILSNSCGLIDSDFRGAVSFKYRELARLGGPGTENTYYKIGDKVGQMLIVPTPKIELVEVDELSETQRNQGSYGSTGR